MPKLSIFTPVGLLRMTSAPSDAKVIFNAKKTALGANRINPAYADASPFTRLEARLYAESVMEAVIRMLLRRAGDVDLPSKIHPELIPLREYEWGVVPGSGESWGARRGGLKAAYRLPGGGDRRNIEATLRALLGDGFVYYRTTKLSEIVQYPSGGIAASPINLQPPGVKRVVIRIDPVNGISLPSASPQTVYYAPLLPALAPGGTTLIQAEDVLVIEPEISARAERVTVVGAGTDLTLGPWFSAVVRNAHEPGAVATTAPFPFWVTNQRLALIIVTPDVAADPDATRRIHNVMQTLARGVSTWAIAAQTGVNSTGPFQIGISPLGTTTLGTITFP